MVMILLVELLEILNDLFSRLPFEERESSIYNKSPQCLSVCVCVCVSVFLSFCVCLIILKTGAEGPSFQIFDYHWGRRPQGGRSPPSRGRRPPLGGEAPLERGGA